MNTQDPKYQQKSKSISSAETNNFGHFAMRYPVCKYVPANLEVMNPVCKGRYPCKGVGLYSHGLKSGDIIVGVEANDSFEELR